MIWFWFWPTLQCTWCPKYKKGFKGYDTTLIRYKHNVDLISANFAVSSILINIVNWTYLLINSWVSFESVKGTEKILWELNGTSYTNIKIVRPTKLVWCVIYTLSAIICLNPIFLFGFFINDYRSNITHFYYQSFLCI